jgi:cytochrome c oxidase assembly protein Cox11
MKNLKIVATAKIDNQELLCFGTIEIHFIKEHQAYITWQFYNENTLIAGKSENYFYKIEDSDGKDLINRVIKNIQGYRIGRDKIFTNIKILS